MLKRTILKDMIEWKTDKKHKALLITGARQIGKTYIIRKFAQEQYPNFLEINFVIDENARTIFDDVSDVDMISTTFSLLSGRGRNAGCGAAFCGYTRHWAGD